MQLFKEGKSDNAVYWILTTIENRQSHWRKMNMNLSTSGAVMYSLEACTTLHTNIWRRNIPTVICPQGSCSSYEPFIRTVIDDKDCNDNDDWVA